MKFHSPLPTISNEIDAYDFQRYAILFVDDEATTRLSSPFDPTPTLLDARLGRNDEATVSRASVKMLAAFIAIYDAGGIVRRIRGSGLTLDVMVSIAPAKTPNPGTETAKWLIDDDLLISAALGLL